MAVMFLGRSVLSHEWVRRPHYPRQGHQKSGATADDRAVQDRPGGRGPGCVACKPRGVAASDRTVSRSRTRDESAAERALRHSLEQFHWTRNDPKAVTAAWPHLGSEDRFLRFAARVVGNGAGRNMEGACLAEMDPATSLIAMLALARLGGVPRTKSCSPRNPRAPRRRVAGRSKRRARAECPE